MHTTWVIAADSSRARIFQMSDEDAQLREIDDLINPAGRETDRDLNSDSKGRYYGKGEGHQAHTVDPQVDAVAHETELFSKRLGNYLDKACLEHRFDNLFLIAPPKFLGLIRHNLAEETREVVAEEIPKELAWFEGRDIERYLEQRKH